MNVDYCELPWHIMEGCGLSWIIMNSNGLQTIILGVIAINLTLLTIIQFTTKEETSKQQIIPVNSDGSIDVSIIDSYQLNVKIDEIDDDE